MSSAIILSSQLLCHHSIMYMCGYYTLCNAIHSYFSFILRLLGNGVSSIISSGFFLLRRQLPRTGFNATDPWTRSDVVLFKNVLMSGFSFLPPHARCFPKNDSTGSWQNHSLNRYLTPSSFNRYFAISTVHCKVIHVNFNMLCEWLLILTCYPEPL